MIYDITTLQKAIETLAGMFQVEESRIINTGKEKQIAGVDLFLKEIEGSLQDFDIDDLKIVGIHSTTNNDQCASIKRTGLINMKQALSCDSSLNEYLHSNGIYIDIYTKKLTYQNKSYNLVDQGNSKLHYKIFGDYQLDCFLTLRENRPYDGALRARPKVLSEIEKYVGLKGLHQGWIDQSAPYMIKFIDRASNFNPYSFSADGSEVGMKTALVYYALMVISSHQQIDVQIDLASEYQVTPEHILEIIPICEQKEQLCI